MQLKRKMKTLRNSLKIKLFNESEEWLVDSYLNLVSELVLFYIIKQD